MADTSKPTEEEIKNFVSEILAEWLPFAAQSIIAAMEKRGLISSGELTESVLGKYLGNSVNGDPVASLVFETYGRYMDLKKLARKPMPNDVIMGVLQEWVNKRGLGAFKYVPGYKTKPNISEDMQLKRIAWGIGKSKKISKAKGWRYAKRKTSLIINLTERLATSYAEVTQRMIKRQLEAA